MSTLFIFLWFIFGGCSIIGAVLWIAAKRRQSDVKFKRRFTLLCLISSFIFFVSGIVTSMNEPIPSSANLSEVQEDNTQKVAKNEIDQIIDVTQFSRITQEELVSIMGEPDSKEEWVFKRTETESYDTTSYYYDNEKFEFMVIDGKVVRFTYNGKPNEYDSEKELFELFNIKTDTGIAKVAETPAAIRFQKVSDKIDDFWVSLGKESVIYKLTYDNGYFGGYDPSLLPDLELIEHDSLVEEYSRYIVGKIKNNTNETYSYVEVTISLFDDAGNQVGSTMDNVNNLAPGTTWKFDAIILEDSVASYKISDITGF